MNQKITKHINPWRQIAILMIVLMDVSWITPWFRSLTPETYAIPSYRILITLSLTILISYLLIIGMDYLRLKKNVRRGLVIVLLVVASLIGIKGLIYTYQPVSLSELLIKPVKSFGDVTSLIPVEFIIIITILVAFWRGLTLAQETIGPSAVKGHFLIGIIMYVAFIFLITLVTGEDPGGYYFLFLISSLIGISSARMTVIEVIRGGNVSRFEFPWFIGIIFAGGFVVGLSAMISGLVANKFTWIGALFLGLFSSILIVLWIILNPVITYLITIASKLFNRSNATVALEDSLNRLNNLINGLGQKVSEIMEKSGIPAFLSHWGPAIKTILYTTIIMFIIIGIILWMKIRLWKNRERRFYGNEEKSSLTINDLLKSVIETFRRRWTEGQSSLSRLIDLRHRQRIRAAERIRQIYADLLDMSELLGQPRPESRTPLEFLPKLQSLLPEYSLEVNQITQAYLGIRYGLQPESESVLAEVEAAWKRLSEAGRTLLNTVKSK